MTIETGTPQQAIRHPLDPLTAARLKRQPASSQRGGRITPRVRIMAYSLLEPEKDIVLAFQLRQPCRVRCLWSCGITIGD